MVQSFVLINEGGDYRAETDQKTWEEGQVSQLLLRSSWNDQGKQPAERESVLTGATYDPLEGLVLWTRPFFKGGDQMLTPKLYFGSKEPWLNIISLEIILEDEEKRVKLCRDFPEFGSITKPSRHKIGQVLEKILNQNRADIQEAQANFTLWWEPVEELWYQYLSGLFDICFRSNFNAQIGIGNLFPRDIESESFLLSYQLAKPDLIRICAHETSHFFFYRKLNEQFGDTDLKSNSQDFWIVSEILVPLIFSDEDCKQILGQLPQSSYLCEEQLILELMPVFVSFKTKSIDFKRMVKELILQASNSHHLNRKYLNPQ